MRSVSSSVTDNVEFTTGVNPRGDVIFLPIDSFGSPGKLNSEILQVLGLSQSYLPNEEVLRPGYALIPVERRWLCFVVTVDGARETEQLLSEHLRKALNDPEIEGCQSLWLPLMGTGAGRLDAVTSQQLTLNALNDMGWLSRSDVLIILSAPPDTGPRLEAIADPVTAEEDSTDFAMGPAVSAAFSFATDLRAGRRRSRPHLSTSLLFFALAESQSAQAPRELVTDRSASLFSGAVHVLAGDRLRAEWDRYFLPGFVPTAQQNHQPAAPLTENVADILRNSARISKAAGRDLIELDDFITAYLTHGEGNHIGILEAMGFKSSDLLREYRDALTGQIGKKLLNDVAADIDQLGYESYATAISDFLLDVATPPPLSISIQAPWGAGKSSLMRQIRNKIDPPEERNSKKLITDEDRLRLSRVLDFLDGREKDKDKDIAATRHLWSVWFNVWKYDTSEQVWAGLVDAVVSQVSNRLPPADRELFLLRLQLARIDDRIIRQKIYDKVISVWWGKIRGWLIGAAGSVAALFSAKVAVQDSLAGTPTALALLSWAPLTVIVPIAIYVVGTYLKSNQKTKAEPATFSLAPYLTVPNYSQSLGNIHHIHEDLLKVLAKAPVREQHGRKTPTPIVIFIDDLDRCSPSKVANVVEGVSMFLASEDYRCMFVIGMDPQMIAAALEEAHGKVRDQLPRYERTVPLGWRFMDKFVQLPFTIPPSNSGTLKKYLDWLSEDGQPDTDENTETNTPPEPVVVRSVVGKDFEQGVDSYNAAQKSRTQQRGSDNTSDESVRLFKESRDVGMIIRAAAKNLSGNPREIKKLANLARLYLGLRNARRRLDPRWRSPTLDQYARWITVTLKWPDMLRWLQWGADEASWPAAEIQKEISERRLSLMQAAAANAATAQDWAKGLKNRLSVPAESESDWACDPKLYEFFVAEAGRQQSEQLSEAVARGFW